MMAVALRSNSRCQFLCDDAVVLVVLVVEVVDSNAVVLEVVVNAQ